MKNSRPGWWLAGLLVLAVAMAVGTSGWGDLYNETDGQYGGAAKVMLQGGSLLIPENNGIPRLVKPPLLYWAMTGAMKIFGVNEFAARLPGALSLCGLVGVTFLFGQRLGGAWRGFCAGAIMLTFLGTFTLGRIVMPEPAFAMFIAASLYCALRGAEEPRERRWWFLGFWLCASLACFTKGLHGLLYPLAVVGVAALFVKAARPRLRGLLSGWGVLIFLVVNIPWYAYVETQFPGYLHNLIFAEQIGHIAGSDSPATSYTSVPRWQFLLLHFAWFFPWSLVAVVTWFIDRRKRAGRPAHRFEHALIVAWAVVVLGSVLLTGERQDYYAMAMWPAAALWLAWLLDRESLRAGAGVLAGVMLLAAFASIALLAVTVSTGTVAERATAWTTVTSFDGSVWRSLRVTAWFALGGAGLCSIPAIWLRGRAAFVSLVAAAVCLNIGAVSGTAIVAPYFSLARMAPELRPLPEERLVYDGNIDTGSSLLFYTDSLVTLLDQRPEEDFFVRKFGLGKDRFISTKELVQLWKTDEPVAFVTEIRRLPEWRETFGDDGLQPMAESGTQILLKNRR